MDKKPIKITIEGRQALEKELKVLKDERQPHVIKRVATAREFGDLSENAEYHAAREDLAWIQGRIEEIEHILAQAEVVKANGDSTVSLGHQVVLLTQDGREQEFHIVGEWEADPMAQKISHESPLGQALVGKKVGEIAQFEAPAGTIAYTVKAIK